MAQLHSIEEQENEEPILLIVSEKNLVSENLLSELLFKFRVIFVSGQKIRYKNDPKNLYSLSFEKANILPNLRERIDYSIIIQSSEKEKEALSPIFEKLKTDNAKTLLLLDVINLKRNVDLILNLKNFDNFYFAVLGEVIDLKNEKANLFSSFLKDVAINERAVLKEESKKEVFPITVDDALKNIHRLLFGKFKRDILYFLFYKEPSTLNTTLHIVSRINPNINVTLREGEDIDEGITREQIKELSNKNLRMGTEYLESDTGRFAKVLPSVLKDTERQNEEQVLVEEPEKEEKKDIYRKLTKTKKREGRFLPLAIFVGIFIFIILNITFVFGAIHFSKKTVESVMAKDFAKASFNASITHKFLTVSKPAAFTFFEIAKPFDKNQGFKETFNNLDETSRLAILAGQSIENFNNGNAFKSKRDFKSLISDLVYLYSESEKNSLINPDGKFKKVINENFTNLLTVLSNSDNLLGFDGSKNYLILFQNENIIRPSGGFIASVGEVSVNNGLLSEIKASDAFSLDANLKTHIEPPFYVRRYIQPHLYLRDSNSFLDFKNTATSSSHLYNLETGKKVDGVVAFNFNVISKLLEITGPLRLLKTNNEVNSDNLSSLLLKTTDSTEGIIDTDLLDAILMHIFQNLKNNSQMRLQLLTLIEDSLIKKEVTIYSFDNITQKTLEVNNYVNNFNLKPDSKTLQDFVFFNESNINNAPINPDIKRDAKYFATLSQNELVSEAMLELENKNSSQDYATYLQLAVPLKSVLDEIVINGKFQLSTEAIIDPKIYEDKDFKKPDRLEVEEYENSAFKVFAFPVNVPSGEKMLISVKYKNGAFKKLPNNFSYSLNYIKQSGTTAYNLATNFSFSNGFLFDKTPNGNMGTNSVLTTQIIETDFSTNYSLKENKPSN